MDHNDAWHTSSALRCRYFAPWRNSADHGQAHDPSRIHGCGAIDGVEVDPSSWLVRGLPARFAPLDEEARLSAVVALLSFQRRPSDTNDALITRFEVTRQRAVLDDGGAAAETASLMLLRARHVSHSQFQQLTVPMQHRRPNTGVELSTLALHLRRMGQVLVQRPGNFASSIGSTGGAARQAFFGDNTLSEAEGFNFLGWGGSTASGSGLGFAHTQFDLPAESDPENSGANGSYTRARRLRQPAAAPQPRRS